MPLITISGEIQAQPLNDNFSFLNQKNDFDMFFLSSNTTTIYVNGTTGDDGNDGSISSPVKTITKAVNLSPALIRGQFASIYIDIASGTYKESIDLIGFPMSIGTRIWFVGKVDGSNIPTVIVDCDNTRTYGFQVLRGINLLLQNISVINIPSNGYGITASAFCYLYYDNIKIRKFAGATGVTGILNADNCRVYTKNLDIDAVNIGLEVIGGSVATVGYTSSTASITNCTDSGVLFQECSTGHIDYLTTTGCNYGVKLTVFSRANMSNNTITSNTVGIGSHQGSRMFLNAGNSISGNTTNTEFIGHGGRYNADGSVWIPVDSYDSLPSATTDYRGVIVNLKGVSTAADTLYVCLKSAGGTVHWIPIVSG